MPSFLGLTKQGKIQLLESILLSNDEAFEDIEENLLEQVNTRLGKLLNLNTQALSKSVNISLEWSDG